MATAWVSEHAGVGVFAAGQTSQALQEPANATHTVAYTTTAQSVAFGSNTRVIAFRVAAAAWFQIGPNPDASTITGAGTAFPISADTEYVRAVKPGDKIAFYDGTS